MKKYLDLDDIKAAIMEMPATEDEKIMLVKRLSRILAADVVPVVRCRDCIHGTPDINRRGEPRILCAVGSEFMLHEIEWFCADGQRRESVE